MRHDAVLMRCRLTVRGIRLRLTVLADPPAVDRAANGGRASRDGRMVVAYVEPARRRNGWHRMTLPLLLCTPGIVAHEALHVALAAGRGEALPDEEPLAYAVQAMTDAIWRRLMTLEAQCG
jgi:hypothetical protein